MYRIQFDSVLTGKNPGNYVTIFEIYFYKSTEHFDRTIFSGIDFNDQAVC